MNNSDLYFSNRKIDTLTCCSVNVIYVLELATCDHGNDILNII